MEIKTVNIAILGMGTIGSATYTNIVRLNDLIVQKSGIRLNVSKILEKEPEKHLHKVENECHITSDFEEILNDPSIDIVVELMGGTGFAKECVCKCLQNRKHVVTANKALIAEHALEIDQAVRSSSASFFYEAAVAGGIPVIAALKNSFLSNSINKIQSIVNGTCNYILTEMTQKNVDFPEALTDAKNKGYAEADPRFDIEGIDAAHKIAILSGLAFRQIVDFKKMRYIQGITQISIHDILIAKESGYQIKLIASTEMTENGLDVRVQPCLVNQHHPLASVEGVYNAVFIEGDPVGKTMFYGRGAGGDPTSSAVISDLITCATNCVRGQMKHNLYYEDLESEALIAEYGNRSKFYIRIRAKDRPGVLAKVAGILGKNDISIETVVQKTSGGADEYVPVFLTTHEADENNLIQAVNEIGRIKDEAHLNETPFVMKILE